jgi:hypothetical protein
MKRSRATEARDQLVCVGRRLRSRLATGDRLLRSC